MCLGQVEFKGRRVTLQVLRISFALFAPFSFWIGRHQGERENTTTVAPLLSRSVAWPRGRRAKKPWCVPSPWENGIHHRSGKKGMHHSGLRPQKRKKEGFHGGGAYFFFPEGGLALLIDRAMRSSWTRRLSPQQSGDSSSVVWKLARQARFGSPSHALPACWHLHGRDSSSENRSPGWRAPPFEHLLATYPLTQQFSYENTRKSLCLLRLRIAHILPWKNRLLTKIRGRRAPSKSPQKKFLGSYCRNKFTSEGISINTSAGQTRFYSQNCLFSFVLLFAVVSRFKPLCPNGSVSARFPWHHFGIWIYTVTHKKTW